MSLTNSGYLTTGQVAKLCGVAMRTVSKWFDSGKLPGYKLPLSQDRRILPGGLVRFLEDHGVPVPHKLRPRAVLACGLDLACAGWVTLPAVCPAAAGSALERLRPDAVVIDVGAWGLAVALPLAAWLLGQPEPPRVLLVATEDVPPGELAARVPGAGAVAGPLLPEVLAAWLEGRHDG